MKVTGNLLRLDAETRKTPIVSLLVIHLKACFHLGGKTEGSAVTLIPWRAAEQRCINNVQHVMSSASMHIYCPSRKHHILLIPLFTHFHSC